MIEWILAQSDIIQFAIGIAFIDLLLLIFIAIKSHQETKVILIENNFAELERICGKMS